MIYIDRERMRHLLKELSLEWLQIEDAPELRQLLLEESQRTGISTRYQKTLSGLITILTMYINGEVNLNMISNLEIYHDKTV